MSRIARRIAIDMLEIAFSGPRGGAGSIDLTSPRKRTVAALNEVALRVEKLINQRPGLRVEQINKQLGTQTKDLALPIRNLIAKGAIDAKGKKRSTTYYPR